MPRTAALQAARDRITAAGGHINGPAPYGYRYAGGGGRLTPIRDEQAVRFLILHLRGLGLSLQAIVNELERLQLRMRSGAPWRRDAVHRIVTAPPVVEDPG